MYFIQYITIMNITVQSHDVRRVTSFYMRNYNLETNGHLPINHLLSKPRITLKVQPRNCYRRLPINHLLSKPRITLKITTYILKWTSTNQ